MSYQRIADRIVEISSCDDELFGLTESGDLYRFIDFDSITRWVFVANSPLVEVEDSKVRPPRPESK